MVGEVDNGNDPKSYEKTILDVDSRKWLEAMKFEIDFIHVNKVWTLVDPLEGIVPIGCKLIFKRKINKDRQVQTYKARPVAKWYTQKQGLAYKETFSLVIILKSIKIMRFDI